MESLEIVRDIAVIVLALVGLLAAFMLVVTGVLLWRMVAGIRTDMGPIIDSIRDTVDTVRATTETVQHTVTESAQSTSGTMRVARRALRLLRRRFR